MGGDIFLCFLLRTCVLHQNTIKCHRLSVVCHDQYGERAFVVVARSVLVVFALLSSRWQIAVAALPSFAFVLSFLFLSSFLPIVCPPPWPLSNKETLLSMSGCSFLSVGCGGAVCREYCASDKAK